MIALRIPNYWSVTICVHTHRNTTANIDSNNAHATLVEVWKQRHKTESNHGCNMTKRHSEGNKSMLHVTKHIIKIK